MASRPYNGFTPEERTKGGNWYRKNRKAGVIPAPAVCCCCGQTVGVNGHSEDYSEPFGDHIGCFHLCYRCHMAIHCRFKNYEAFKTYRELIKTQTFPPTRDFRVFISDFNSHYKNRQSKPRARVKSTFLDDLPNRHLTKDEAACLSRAVLVARPVEVEQKDLFG